MKKGLQKFTQLLISLTLLLKYRLFQNCKALLGDFALPNGMKAIAESLKSFRDADFVTGNKTATIQLQPVFINSSSCTVMKMKNSFSRGTVMLRC